MNVLLAQATAPTDTDLVKWVIVAIAVVIAIGLIGVSVVSYISFSKDHKITSA